MFTQRICGAALLVAALACASRPSSSAAADPNPATTASRNGDVITAQELADPSVSGGSALEAVRRLRPRFLMTRGSGSVRTASAGSVHISVDGGPLLTLDNLGRMRANDVAEIRYLNASGAALRFGTSAGSGGVILVKTK